MGVSLKNATAKITKTERTKPTADGGQHQGDADPWASNTGTGYSDEPPF